jgi:hypothetical protein
MIVREVVVGRDEHLIAELLGAHEQLLYVLNGFVLLDALPDQFPRDTIGAEEIVLRIRQHECCGGRIEMHGASFIGVHRCAATHRLSERVRAAIWRSP